MNLTKVNDEFIERYQKIWDADQSSHIFAPLAEAYRRSGHSQRALQICQQGVDLHPQFAGGWLQLGKIFADKKDLRKAISALNKAVHLSPDNYQAHNLLADLYLAVKKPLEALKAFKMILLLNPNDARARKTIERLESLTAKDYDEETFQIGFPEESLSLHPSELPAEDEDLAPFSETLTPDPRSVSAPQVPSQDTSRSASQTPPQTTPPHTPFHSQDRALEQTLTLIDALLVRNEFTKARTIVVKALNRFGHQSELEGRLQLIESQRDQSLEMESREIIQPVPPRPERLRIRKIKQLQSLLKKIEEQS